MNPNVNYGLWVMIMCQHRFIHFNKCPTLVGSVDNGGAYACMRAGGYGKSLYLPHNFALKKTVFKKKESIGLSEKS